MSLVLRTPDLPRAVADYTGVLGFECRQHIPGVLAVVVHGPLMLQLWACGARPGRWEHADPRDTGFAPGHHSVAVTHIHALHASLRRASLRGVRTHVAGTQPLHASRLDAEGPRLQPWGAWEFAFHDIDGHVLHCVDWGLPQHHPAGQMLLDGDPLEDGA